MKKVIFYLLVWIALTTILLLSHHIWTMPQWYIQNLLFIKCSLLGAMGGILYCLRGVYLSKCVRKNWDPDWEVWYYLRPITSTISGVVSCIFLKAGLLTLDAEPRTDAFIFGYLAVAFIAGYNVDNFLKKLESIACEIWGIKKSRSSNIDLNNKDESE